MNTDKQDEKKQLRELQVEEKTRAETEAPKSEQQEKIELAEKQCDAVKRIISILNEFNGLEDAGYRNYVQRGVIAAVQNLYF